MDEPEIPKVTVEKTEARKINLLSKTEAGTEFKRRIVEQPENMQLRLGPISHVRGR